MSSQHILRCCNCVILIALACISTNGKQILHGISGSLNPNISNTSNASYNTDKLEIWFDSLTVTSEDIATVTFYIFHFFFVFLLLLDLFKNQNKNAYTHYYKTNHIPPTYSQLISE